MKEFLQQLLADALAELRDVERLAEVDADTAIPLERSRRAEQGDFASPVALALAKTLKRNPRELAERIVERIPPSDRLERIEIAGPGFINFFLTDTALQDIVTAVLEQGEAFGRCRDPLAGRVQVEFVSANPTGPLHVGHGRGAAYGDAVARLLSANGWQVQREYYINDGGRQIDIMAVSIWTRYLGLCGESAALPSKGYKGDYILAVAEGLKAEHGRRFVVPGDELGSALPDDGPAEQAQEDHVSALIQAARRLLGAERYSELYEYGVTSQVGAIRADLEAFGIEFDRWYSERSLKTGDTIQRAVNKLKERGYAYEREGAVWFRSSGFGDEKDRVLIRDNGEPTYFAPDLAYHMEKLERGFDWIIDVWGADHHGYLPRMKGGIEALGERPERLTVIFVQFANLYRGGEKVSMSTRAGEFVTLQELREEVGNDAARFFYVTRRSDQHLDFDLDLAKSRSNENPVFYIQYAHARVASVLRQAKERGLDTREALAAAEADRLTEAQELRLMKTIARYPPLVRSAGADLEPHQIGFYLRELANEFHTYYNAHTILVDDAGLRSARIALAVAARQVIANGLAILGVSAPESM